MATGNSTSGGSTTYLKLRAKTSETDGTPFFGKAEKKGDAWELTEKYSWVSGHLEEVKHETYTYEGETKDKVVMILVDPDGSKTHIEANYNSLTYSILNSLASFSPREVRIEVWLGKAKVIDGKQGKQYPSAAVKVEGADRIGWKYTFNDIPKATEEVYKGKKIKDESNVIKFWTNVIEKEIAPKLVPFEKGKVTEAAVNTEEENSGLPF